MPPTGSQYQASTPLEVPPGAKITACEGKFAWTDRVYNALSNHYYPPTMLDLHKLMHRRITHKEYFDLGYYNQQRVSRAFHWRTSTYGGYSEGVKRVDFLMGKTTLVGLTMRYDGKWELELQ